jgi:hypothetical protein
MSINMKSTIYDANVSEALKRHRENHQNTLLLKYNTFMKGADRVNQYLPYYSILCKIKSCSD